MSAIPTMQTHTRGTAYTHQTLTVTIDTITIDQSANLPMYIDHADEAQTSYAKQMEMADLQGTLINENYESKMLAAHASFTNFDNASIGGGAGNITVSSSNIDDIIRGVKREIGEANGQQLADRHGMFIVWRYADLELLEQFAQAGIKFIGLIKSSLINGEHLIVKAKATLSKALCQLQRLSERTLLMSEATVRTI